LGQYQYFKNMSRKAILLTFISAVAVICLAGVLSYLVWANQPQADTEPPVPPLPEGAPTEKPPVPAIPRLSGDVLDDGIVSALDINSIIVHWKQVTDEYNLIDSSSEAVGLISSLDLNQTIKYWQCVEQKGVAVCPYLSSTTGNDTPPVPPTPTASTTVTVTTTSTSNDTPPTPPTPTN
jgi:hypothetical protein